MTRREAILTALGLFVAALVARIVVASVIVFPKPEDTAYYVGVARNLLEGRGLVTDALWSFATPDLVIPHPAFEVWLPLPTFLAAIPMAFLGTTFQAEPSQCNVSVRSSPYPPGRDRPTAQTSLVAMASTLKRMS